MTHHVPKGFDPGQQKVYGEFISQLNEKAKKLPEKFHGLSRKQKILAYISMFLSGCGAFYMSIKEIDFAGTLCGLRVVKHFVFHGVKLSTDVFVEVLDKFFSFDFMETFLKSTVETNIHTIGSAFTAGLVHIIMGVLETLYCVSRYIWNSWLKGNNVYTKDALVKDLKKLWKANLLAAGVTSVVSGGLATALVACGVTVAWPFLVSTIAAGIIGTLAKWSYNNRGSIFKSTKYSKIKRDKLYNQFAKAENSKHKYKKNEKWPEHLTELIWIFESMECLSFVVEGTLKQEIIDEKYKKKSGDVTSLKGFDKLDKEGLWVFRRTILSRYIHVLQGSGDEVEEVIVEACKIRLNEINGETCLVM